MYTHAETLDTAVWANVNSRETACIKTYIFKDVVVKAVIRNYIRYYENYICYDKLRNVDVLIKYF